LQYRVWLLLLLVFDDGRYERCYEECGLNIKESRVDGVGCREERRYEEYEMNIKESRVDGVRCREERRHEECEMNYKDDGNSVVGVRCSKERSLILEGK
jgi:hypothetical protein